jgi:hypothetical protein
MAEWSSLDTVITLLVADAGQFADAAERGSQSRYHRLKPSDKGQQAPI